MSEVKEQILRCPLCGHRFAAGNEACRPGCPFRKNCGLICCPHRGYQFVGDSKLIGRWKRFWGEREKKEGA